MCGRFTLRTPMPILIEQFMLFEDFDYTPAFNIAPTQNVLTIRGQSEGSRYHAERLRWGLIPFWAKDKSIGAKMINARGETVREKPAFRAAFKKRRCLVLSDGYYEWKKQTDGKQPYLIHMKSDAPFAYAGLWERWEKGEAPIESCTIITTDSNEVTSDVHDRMPVILKPEDYETWLSEDSDPDELQSLIKPFEEDILKVDKVSRYVNNVRNQGPECVEPPGEESN